MGIFYCCQQHFILYSSAWRNNWRHVRFGMLLVLFVMWRGNFTQRTLPSLSTPSSELACPLFVGNYLILDFLPLLVKNANFWMELDFGILRFNHLKYTSYCLLYKLRLPRSQFVFLISVVGRKAEKNSKVLKSVELGHLF